MTDEAKQAVATDADAQQPAGAEAVGAQAEPTLDEVLDSMNFSSQSAEAQSEPSSQTAADNALAKRLEATERKLQEVTERLAGQDFDKEFNDTAARLSDGLDVDQEAFKDALYGRVARDSRLSAAYENRGKDPGKWRQIEEALKGEFKSRFPAKQANIDEGMTQDREAVAAAVRGQTSTASRGDQPTDEEIANMSDAEFNAYQRKMGAPMFS